MSVPLLQIALDNTTLSEALKSAKTVGNIKSIVKEKAKYIIKSNIEYKNFINEYFNH